MFKSNLYNLLCLFKFYWLILSGCISTPDIKKKYIFNYTVIYLIYYYSLQFAGSDYGSEYQLPLHMEFFTFNLNTDFLNIWPTHVGIYRHHNEISTKVSKSYCDRYLFLYLFLVTGTFRLNTGIDDFFSVISLNKISSR